jgi:hypothetical protein
MPSVPEDVCIKLLTAAENDPALARPDGTARFGTIKGKGKDWQREKPGRATGCVSGRQPRRVSGDPHRNYQSRGQRD